MCVVSDVLRASAENDQAPVSFPPRSTAVRSIDSTRPEYTEVAPRFDRRPPRVSAASERLILLGTGGGGNPKNTRRGYANAVVVGEAAYIIDCGEGVHQQAWRSGISMHLMRRPPGGSTVRAMVFTHLHSDHIMDYANMLLGFWPTHEVDVYGPGQAGLPIPSYPPGRGVELVFPEQPTPGLTLMTEHLFRAFAYNINVRIADEDRHDVRQKIRTHEIGVTRAGYTPDIDVGLYADGSSTATASPDMEPFVVRPTDEFGVTIRATLVQHAPVFPALGYRIDTPNGSVAFSGDTGPCDNVVRLAQGADVLVHEVIDVDFLRDRVSKMPNRDAIIAHLVSSHTLPEDAARIAQRAGVKTLVMSHLVPGDDEFSEAEWESRARPYFDGEVVCGVDLDQFTLGS
jgi:ribonuclease BN (tRNA processing enzyme)